MNDDATIEVGTTTASGGTLMLKDGTEIFGHGTGALNIGFPGIVQIATNNDGTGIAATFDDLNVTLQSSVNGSGTIQVGGTEFARDAGSDRRHHHPWRRTVDRVFRQSRYCIQRQY